MISNQQPSLFPQQHEPSEKFGLGNSKESPSGAETPPRKRPFPSLSLLLAGVGPEVAERCTDAERRKLGAIGYTVLVPPAMGLFAAGYAASLLTSNPYIVGSIAIGWAFIVLTIDRAIVATYRESLTPWRKRFQFIFRLAIAALMAATISHPLTLLVFKDTVRREVERTIREDAARESGMQQAEIDKLQGQIKMIQEKLDVPPAQKLGNAAGESPAVQAVRDRLDSLRTQAEQLSREREKVQAELKRAGQDYSNEVNGYGESGRKGEGRIARAIKDTRIVPLSATQAALTAEEKRHRQLIVDAERELAGVQADERAFLENERTRFIEEQSRLRLALEEEQKTFRAEEDHRRARLREIDQQSLARIQAMQQGTEQPDLLAQTLALHGLFADRERGGKFAMAAYLCLLLLFLVVDAMPVIIKFTTKRGEYDEWIDSKHAWAALEAKEELENRFGRREESAPLSRGGSSAGSESNGSISSVDHRRERKGPALSKTAIQVLAVLAVLGLTFGAIWIYHKSMGSKPYSSPAQKERAETLVNEANEKGRQAIKLRAAEFAEFIHSKKAGAKPFSKDMVSYYGRWRVVKSRLLFTDKNGHKKYVAERFGAHIFSNEELAAAIKRSIEGCAKDLESIENDLAVALREEILGRSLKPDEIPIAAEEFKKAIKQLQAASQWDAAKSVGGFVVSEVASQVAVQVLVRLGVSAGILGTAAANSWWTFGVGLLVGILVDCIWEWIDDPAGDIEREVTKALDQLASDGSAYIEDEMNKVISERGQLWKRTINEVILP